MIVPAANEANDDDPAHARHVYAGHLKQKGTA
jgi:hypothetical protein